MAGRLSLRLKITAIARATQNFNKRETPTQSWPDCGPAPTTSDEPQTTTGRTFSAR